MSRARHLLLAVSGHGYGHLAQCAPVINALTRRLPGLQLTLMSTLPQAVLASRIGKEFNFIHAETDPLLRMRSAWEVDIPASQVAFRAFHRRRATVLDRLRGQLRELKPDLLVANIPWLPLTAAAQEHIPAVALGSLNWAAIFSHYLGSCPDSEQILADMWSGYRAAGYFLAPAPALPMPELPNYRALGPIARRGNPQGMKLRRELAVTAENRLVLVGLGGIDTKLPLDSWPQLDGVTWLFHGKPGLVRTDMAGCRDLDMPVIDILASADAVLTKPGYGTYTEAVCNGVPLLTLERPDWPETPYLNAWAREHGSLSEISLQQFHAGSFAGVVAALLQRPKPAPLPPAGARQAVDLLAAMLTRPRERACP
jgi:hypothetical protein